MNANVPSWLLFVVCVTCCAPALAQEKSAMHADKSEAVLLPPYCYNQMLDPNLTGPKYTIEGCGGAMNHYCLSLLSEIRANRTFGNMGLKRRYLDRATTDIQYTLARMDPACPIAGDVRATERRLANSNRIFNNK